MLKMIGFSFLAIIISSCATSNLESQTKITNYELTSANCTYKNKVIKDYRDNAPMTLLFPSIPGGLWGNPTNDIIQYITAEPGKIFMLKLPSNMSKKASRLAQAGLSITPSNTKVLRLGTFHVYPDYKDSLGGGGFYHKRTSEFLTLVYFSGSSHVTGVQKSEGDIYEFNIKVLKQGWNWIVNSKVGKNKYISSIYEGPLNNIEFCAYVQNAIDT